MTIHCFPSYISKHLCPPIKSAWQELVNGNTMNTYIYSFLELCLSLTHFTWTGHSGIPTNPKIYSATHFSIFRATLTLAPSNHMTAEYALLWCDHRLYTSQLVPLLKSSKCTWLVQCHLVGCHVGFDYFSLQATWLTGLHKRFTCFCERDPGWNKVANQFKCWKKNLLKYIV